MTAGPVPDDWWPEWLQDLASEDPLASDPVVVAAIEETTAAGERYRWLFTALVPLEKHRAVLESPGGIGYGVSTSGPHPLDSRGAWDYSPRFWIEAGEAVPNGLEPLVVSWRSGNHFVLWPDQGFLMTYGLIPRLADKVMHWDDVEAPRRDVVLATPVSTYDFPGVTRASVLIARDFLQDYATIRNSALVQVYYIHRAGPLTDELRGLFDAKQIVEFRLKGRLLDLRLFIDEDDQRVLAQVWGVRPLLTPGAAPISADRWDYGTLEWPAFSGPISHDEALKLRPWHLVYVRDTVLGIYEGCPEYSIHPESGAVSYGNQWSVSWTRRVGRDLIAVELKKLYEGNRPETVRHWHNHAVKPPAEPASREQANVGTRARRIVYGMTSLGEALAAIASQVSTVSVSGMDFVRLDRNGLDYRGWWTNKPAEPITRHIPLELTRDDFLARCSTLYQLIGEGLSEANLRALLEALKVPPEHTVGFRSFKLLHYLIRLADLATRTGLPISSGTELQNRLKEEAAASPLARLFALNELRQLADHRTETSWQQRFEKALETFGLNPAAYAAGWGLALDAVYDGIAETLEMVATPLMQAAG